MEIIVQFDGLEKKKHAFLHTVSSWTPCQLRFRPTPAAWSALQVLDHVVKTEREIFAAAQSGLNQSRTSPLGDRIRGSLLNALMSSPARLKVPAAAALILPDNSKDLPELTDDWISVRRLQRKWIAALGSGYSNKGIFRHPVSGWMTPSQTLGFLSAHLHHHGFQIKRIQRDPAWVRTKATG